MTTPEERIRQLARTDAIADEDAARLLAAVGAAPPGRARDPFVRWSGEVTAVAGVVVSLFGIAASRLGARFDGAVDFHVHAAPVPLAVALVDQLVAFPITALVFYGVARLLAREVRFIDVLGAVGLSRAPLVILAPPMVLLLRAFPFENTMPRGPGLLALAALASLALGAQMFLLVLGFRAASGARGGRLAAGFVGALVAAEVVSKLVLFVVHP